jgi:hypothetical protein
MMQWGKLYRRAARQAHKGDLYLTLRAAFDESKIKRDDQGQFAETDGGEVVEESADGGMENTDNMASTRDHQKRRSDREKKAEKKRPSLKPNSPAMYEGKRVTVEKVHQERQMKNAGGKSQPAFMRDRVTIRKADGSRLVVDPELLEHAG